MDFKFSKESGDSGPQEESGEKKKQSVLLVLLLILVGVFTYVYFFTGLIKSEEVQKTPEASVSEPQVVKIPLPPRDGAPVKPEVKTEATKVAATAPVATPVPAVKPTAVPVAKQVATPVKTPAPAPAVKAAPSPAKPKEEPQKAVAAKPAEKKPLPLPAVEKKVEKASLKTETKKQAADAHKPVLKTKSPLTGTWSLIIGSYVLEEALSTDMGRVRKIGFEPIVKPSVRKKTTMNRLFISDFTDREKAQSTMAELKRHTSDAFVLEQGGRFALYAGSYLQSDAANSEIERLKTVGFTATLKHAEIAIPSKMLSIGPFKSKKEADASLGRLKAAGIKATISQK